MLGQSLQRELNHANGSLHDPLSCHHHAGRLLALQHHLSDFRRAGQSRDPRFNDAHPGRSNASGDIDRDTVRIIDFGRRTLVIADAGRDRVTTGKRIDSVNSSGSDGSPVFAEEEDDTRLSRLHRDQSPERENGEQDKHHGHEMTGPSPGHD